MLTTWSWCRSHKLKGTVPNKTTPTSDVSCKRDLQAPVASSDQLATNPRGSPDSLRFDNSLEWLRMQEGIMIIVLKNINPGPSKWRDLEGEVWEDSECRASIPFSCGIRVRHLPGTSMYSPTRKFHWAELLLDFHYAGMIESLNLPTWPVSGHLLSPRLGWLIAPARKSHGWSCAHPLSVASYLLA